MREDHRPTRRTCILPIRLLRECLACGSQRVGSWSAESSVSDFCSLSALPLASSKCEPGVPVSGRFRGHSNRQHFGLGVFTLTETAPVTDSPRSIHIELQGRILLSRGRRRRSLWTVWYGLSADQSLASTWRVIVDWRCDIGREVLNAAGRSAFAAVRSIRM